MGEPVKLKRCSVKVNRLSYIADPEQIQEQILDLRIRPCSVRLQRCNMNQIAAITSPTVNGMKMRRCYIRLPRLETFCSVHSEPPSSPTDSVISSSILDDSDYNDSEEEI